MKSLLFFTNSQLLATGFLSIFSEVSEFTPYNLTGSFQELLHTVECTPPDILLMDFSPSEDFSDLEELRRTKPACKIVLWVDAISMEAAFQAMKLGVRGILRKTDTLARLVECLVDIAEGTLGFDKELTTKFLQARTIELTPRESQLPPLVAQGLKNKEIAGKLNLSEATVRIYMSALYKKLGVRDRYELAIYAMKNMPGAPVDAETGGDSECAATHEFPRQLSSMIIGTDQVPVNGAKASPVLLRKPLRIAR